jgi:hypothetical protein
VDASQLGAKRHAACAAKKVNADHFNQLSGS